MKLHTLRDLLVDQLKDLYSAETQIIKALPKMAKKATTPELRQGFTEHLEQTREHAARLERIFEELETSPRGKKCAALEGLVEECKELMSEDVEASVLDAGLIACGQKVEHYEMASYGCARTWAEQLGMHEVAGVLQKTFEEEKETDRKLTQIAEQGVNQEAEQGAEALAGAGNATTSRGRNGSPRGRK